MNIEDIKSMEEDAQKQIDKWNDSVEKGEGKLKSLIDYKTDKIEEVTGELSIGEPKSKKKKRTKAVETDVKKSRNKDALF